jgi:hypothetical protein
VLAHHHFSFTLQGPASPPHKFQSQNQPRPLACMDQSLEMMQRRLGNGFPAIALPESIDQ